MAPDGISLCMIVRDGAATLATCLESVAPFVDEAIVVDTGSTDGSIEIARRFGATVIRIDWPGSFAAVRNVYLTAARQPWIVSLDADEFLGGGQAEGLRFLVSRRPVAAYEFRILNYFRLRDVPWPIPPSEFAGAARPGIGATPTHAVRLFPRQQGLEYAYPVYETLEPALKRLRIPVRRSPIVIHHTGCLDDLRARQMRGESHRSLGMRMIGQHPRHWRGYFELGRMLLHQDEFDQAEALLARALRLNPSFPPLYFLSAMALHRADRRTEAARRLEKGLRRFPRHPDLLYMRGVLELDRGNVVQALNCMSPVLTRMPALLGAGHSDAIQNMPFAQVASAQG
jgi:tetratricopeptide (TPR) repeat protein